MLNLILNYGFQILTPNNDGVNDLFKPVVIGVDYYELIITNVGVKLFPLLI